MKKLTFFFFGQNQRASLSFFFSLSLSLSLSLNNNIYWGTARIAIGPAFVITGLVLI
jgi:hypothetical protein